VSVKRNYVLGYSPYDHTSDYPFNEVFKKSKDVKKEGFDGVDCVVFWGGTDIHPSLYKQKAHRYNGAPTFPSDRDVFEHKAALYCRAMGIPMLGICRGAQLLCAEAGGTLVQHCTGHGYDHNIDTNLNKRVKTTSSHHQMMNPWKVPHILIGWSDPHRCQKYEDEDGDNITEMLQHQEPEIVYFPAIRGLAIQGHPEWAGATTEFIALCNQLIRTYLLS
jgi:anthranilate/para-aminobenzoate synthase component II